MSRLGVDVGGTNTDAALLVGDAVVATAKAPSSQDIVSGMVAAVQLLQDSAPSGEQCPCRHPNTSTSSDPERQQGVDTYLLWLFMLVAASSLALALAASPSP